MDTDCIIENITGTADQMAGMGIEYTAIIPKEMLEPSRRVIHIRLVKSQSGTDMLLKERTGKEIRKTLHYVTPE